MASSKVALGGGVGAQRGDATSAGWVAPLVKGEAQVCVTELLLWELGSPSSVPSRLDS